MVPNPKSGGGSGNDPLDLDTTNERLARRRIGILTETLNLLRGVDSEMPMQQAVAFLHVCLADFRGDKLNIKEIARLSNIAQPASSRNMRALGPIHWKPIRGKASRKEGKGLVVFEDDPYDYRSKLVVLSQKGRLLRDSIIRILLQEERWQLNREAPSGKLT